MTPLLGCSSMTLGVALALLAARGCDEAAQNTPVSSIYNYNTLETSGEGKVKNALWHIHRDWVEPPVYTSEPLGVHSIEKTRIKNNKGRSATKLTIIDFGGSLILKSALDDSNKLLTAGRFYKYKSSGFSKPELAINLFDLEFEYIDHVHIKGSQENQSIKVLDLPDHIKSLTIDLKNGKDVLFIKKGNKAQITLNTGDGEPHIIIMGSKNTENNGSLTINTGNSPVNIYKVEEKNIKDLRERIMKWEPGIKAKDRWLKLRESIEAHTVTYL